MPALIDITGRTFGSYTVLGPTDSRGAKGGRLWLCRCACGAEKALRGDTLRAGKARACRSCAARAAKGTERAKEHARSLTRPTHDRTCRTCGEAFTGTAGQQYCRWQCTPQPKGARKRAPAPEGDSVAGITPSQFRLGPDTLADLDALAASNGGQRTAALKEAAAQFRAAVEEAGRANAESLSPEEWTLLGYLNQPDPYADMPDEVRDDLGRWGVDWSQYLAAELVGAWESRAAVLPLHQEQATAARALARKVARFGRVRGYALMAALRWFWEPGTERTIEQCADPAAWMTPADLAAK